MTDTKNGEDTTVEQYDTLEYTFTNLVRSRKYWFKIRVKNGWRSGEFSPSIFIRPLDHRTRPQYS